MTFLHILYLNRYKTDGSGLKPFNELNEEFKRNAVMEYYRAHLEEYNEEFNMQMKELKDGNLFFDIMMREVWSNAQSDTAGQRAFYEQNKSKYKWNYSADALFSTVAIVRQQDHSEIINKRQIKMEIRGRKFQ
jgi:peptidyl-prolyl cis-trans isomerase SurA